jgi:hypothetical protein
MTNLHQDYNTAWTTEYGQYGSYEIGQEYVIRDGLHHLVLRPIRATEFMGYAIDAQGVGSAVTKVSHDGPLSSWRYRNVDGERIITPPSHPPCLSLPDEEHGHRWGDPVIVLSAEPARWYHAGMEISADAAAAGLDVYSARGA